MSRSRTSSPSFRFSFLMCSSLSASSLFGRARARSPRPGGTASDSPPPRLQSAHASAPPAARRFQGYPPLGRPVLDLFRKGGSPSLSTSCRDRITACGWTQLRGEQDSTMPLSSLLLQRPLDAEAHARTISKTLRRVLAPSPLHPIS